MVIFLSSVSTVYSSPSSNTATAPNPVLGRVTADIDAGIRKHVQEVSEANNGFFPLVVQGETLKLKLVKVHTEYLSTLDSHEHFACLDLVDQHGNVHDVDFFIHGDTTPMKVTRTQPHKLNGVPYYFWEQNDEGTWKTVPVDQASQKLLGIIAPTDHFEFRYWATLPHLTGPAKLWIPLAQSDRFQTVEITALHEPQPHRVLDERKHGNKVLFWELGPEDSGKSIDISYAVKRIEKSAYQDPGSRPADYLMPDRLVPADPTFAQTAKRTTAGIETDLQRARALYDLVMAELKYAKVGEGWGQGDAVFACDAQRGNCTDYHAYFIALARSIQIPARFAIGVAIPSNRDEGGIGGYHCWMEFYADGKWWPLDISEADQYAALTTYYFGHNPANRLEFSRGRDLEVTPAPASGPINFLAYPLLEVEGMPVKTPVNFSFQRTGGPAIFKE